MWLNLINLCCYGFYVQLAQISAPWTSQLYIVQSIFTAAGPFYLLVVSYQVAESR